MRFFLLALIFFTSCSKPDSSDHCESSADLGLTQIDEESKEILIYKEGQKIIFKNNLTRYCFPVHLFLKIMA